MRLKWLEALRRRPAGALTRKRIKALARQWREERQGEDEAAWAGAVQTLSPEQIRGNEMALIFGMARFAHVMWPGAPGDSGSRSFSSRARGARWEPRWRLSADEALDAAHPALWMAFGVRMSQLPHLSDPSRREELERLSEQIARRLMGEPSEAPMAEWFNGFLEEAGEGSVCEELRLATLSRLEAKALAKGMAPGRRGGSGARL